MKFTLIVDPNQEEAVTVTAHSPSDLTDKIEALVLSHAQNDTLPVYDEDGLIYLSFSEIECITVEDGKTYAIDAKGQHNRVRMRLYEVEQLLPTCFIRINKSTLANKNRLVRFTASYSGAVDAVFKCGYRDYVSRRCFAEIKRRLEHK